MDIALRGAQLFFQVPQHAANAPASVAQLGVSAQPSHPVMTDIYAGICGYVGVVAAADCLSNTVRNLRRSPQGLMAALETPAPISLPARLGRPERDHVGWWANCITAGLFCGSHAMQACVGRSHALDNNYFRYATGCLVGAGLVLTTTAIIALFAMLLPERYQLGRNTHRSKGAITEAIRDPKCLALTHMGLGMAYSGATAVAAGVDAGHWHYDRWGSPMLAAAAGFSLASACYVAIRNYMALQRTPARAPIVAHSPHPKFSSLPKLLPSVVIEAV